MLELFFPAAVICWEVRQVCAAIPKLVTIIANWQTAHTLKQRRGAMRKFFAIH